MRRLPAEFRLEYLVSGRISGIRRIPSLHRNRLHKPIFMIISPPCLPYCRLTGRQRYDLTVFLRAETIEKGKIIQIEFVPKNKYQVRVYTAFSWKFQKHTNNSW